MLQKITFIKNLGVFSDYSWDTSLPSFARYNVIYGDNGSGKTTLSRLLGCINFGSHEEYPDLKYNIESQSGVISQGTKATRSVRVFNSDYVQRNIGQLEGKLKPILVVGEENKAVAAQLALDEKELKRRDEIISAAQNRVQSHENERGKKFTAIAKTISEATSGTTTRTYRKNNAEAAYKVLGAGSVLTPEQLETCRKTLRQDVMDSIPEPAFSLVQIDGGKGHLKNILRHFVIPHLLFAQKRQTVL